MRNLNTNTSMGPLKFISFEDLYICLSVWVPTPVCMQEAKTGLYPLELELQAFVGHGSWDPNPGPLVSKLSTPEPPSPPHPGVNSEVAGTDVHCEFSHRSDLVLYPDSPSALLAGQCLFLQPFQSPVAPYASYLSLTHAYPAGTFCIILLA